MKKLLLFALVSVAMPAAHAQTGRIAHLSHGGSVAARATASDNFGIYILTEWKNDSLVCVGTARVEHRGMSRQREGGSSGPVIQEWARRVDQYPAGELQWLKTNYPKATLVYPAGKTQLRKSSGHVPAPGRHSLPHGYWRGLATVAALGAVGWLLSRKSKAA